MGTYRPKSVNLIIRLHKFPVSPRHFPPHFCAALLARVASKLIFFMKKGTAYLQFLFLVFTELNTVALLPFLLLFPDHRNSNRLARHPFFLYFDD